MSTAKSITGLPLCACPRASFVQNNLFIFPLYYTNLRAIKEGLDFHSPKMILKKLIDIIYCYKSRFRLWYCYLTTLLNFVQGVQCMHSVLSEDLEDSRFILLSCSRDYYHYVLIL